jgi:hypothetical protein
MKELQELRNEVLNLRNIGELTKQTESILLHKLNALQETINYTRCSLQLLDGMMQIENAYIEDADDVGSYYVDGRYTKVFVLEKEFDDNKCIKN